MITISKTRCVGCLKCSEVCPDYVIGVDSTSGSPIAVVKHEDQCCCCGHCVAVCANNAIIHQKIPKDSLIPLSQVNIQESALKNLLYSRRSIRAYKPDPVPNEVIEQLLELAGQAGSGGNVQTEGFIVVQDRQYLQDLELEVVDTLWRAGLKHARVGSLVTKMMQKKLGPELTHQYVSYHGIIKNRRANNDVTGMIFRNAPLVLLAHGLKSNGLARSNCALALRNAELLALCLGLGTCWVGFLLAAIEKKPGWFGKKLGLDRQRQVYGALMVGYPKNRYRYKLPRQHRQVTWF